MKICMLLYAYFPYDESRALREAMVFRRGNEKIEVICLKKENDPIQSVYNGIKIYRLPIKKYENKKLLPYLLEYLKSFILFFLHLTYKFFLSGYNIIYIHTPPDWLVFTAIIPKMFGRKIVIDVHDVMPELYLVKFGLSGNSVMFKILKLIEKLTLQFGNKIITPTKIWEKRYLNFKIKKNKIKIIMNLPDEHIFKSKHIIPKNYQKFKIIYHGTITLRYGVDILLESVKLIEKKIPNLKVYIIGEGDLLPYLLDLTKKLSLEGKVYFSKKFIPVETLPNLLQHMDVGIVPNRGDVFTTQVLNAKLLEYLAMGIPVVASKTCTLREYFKKGEVLFFTPESPKELGEKILLIYKNKKLRETLRRNGRKFLTNYNWEKEGQKLYQFVCN